MTELNHVAATTPASEVVEHLRRDGYVIIDDLAPPGLMDRIQDEVEPYIDATPMGYTPILGKKTRRTGALIARSPACRELIQDPTVLGVCEDFLGHATAFQLMLTQIISIEPGESAQGLHRDQIAWDHFPFPEDYHVQCNTLWALSDYTVEMGATRIVPDSHLPGSRHHNDYSDAECLQAEMSRGSVILYSGKIVHSGGANRSDRVRRAINVNYSVGWVRQEENQYIACPPEIAKTLDDDLLKLMGYQEGAFSMGYFRDFEDPLRYLRGDEAVPYGFDFDRVRNDAQGDISGFLAHSE
jgi:hypothetical protein